MEAAAGKFNPHVHVEYDWNLRLEEIDESDDDLDDKVTSAALTSLTWVTYKNPKYTTTFVSGAGSRGGKGPCAVEFQSNQQAEGIWR